MGERKIRGVRVLLAAGLAVLLFGCMYGNPYGYSASNGYGGYDDQYYGNGQYVDPAEAVLGPAVAGIEHLLIGPIVGSIMGGTMGYGYGQPYYHDRYYNDRYGSDRGYDDRYYNDRYYDDYNYDPYYPR
jgi:hypothetical protein